MRPLSSMSSLLIWYALLAIQMDAACPIIFGVHTGRFANLFGVTRPAGKEESSHLHGSLSLRGGHNDCGPDGPGRVRGRRSKPHREKGKRETRHRSRSPKGRKRKKRPLSRDYPASTKTIRKTRSKRSGHAFVSRRRTRSSPAKGVRATVRDKKRGKSRTRGIPPKRTRRIISSSQEEPVECNVAREVKAKKPQRKQQHKRKRRRTTKFLPTGEGLVEESMTPVLHAVASEVDNEQPSPQESVDCLPSEAPRRKKTRRKRKRRKAAALETKMFSGPVEKALEATTDLATLDEDNLATAQEDGTNYTIQGGVFALESEGASDEEEKAGDVPDFDKEEKKSVKEHSTDNIQAQVVGKRAPAEFGEEDQLEDAAQIHRGDASASDQATPEAGIELLGQASLLVNGSRHEGNESDSAVAVLIDTSVSVGVEDEDPEEDRPLTDAKEALEIDNDEYEDDDEGAEDPGQGESKIRIKGQQKDSEEALKENSEELTTELANARDKSNVADADGAVQAKNLVANGCTDAVDLPSSVAPILGDPLQREVATMQTVGSNATAREEQVESIETDSSSDGELDIPMRVDDLEVTIHVDKDERVTVRLGDTARKGSRDPKANHTTTTWTGHKVGKTKETEMGGNGKKGENAAFIDAKSRTVARSEGTMRTASSDDKSARMADLALNSTAQAKDKEPIRDLKGYSLLQGSAINYQKTYLKPAGPIHDATDSSSVITPTVDIKSLISKDDEDATDEDEDTTDFESDGGESQQARTSSSVQYKLNFNGGSIVVGKGKIPIAESPHGMASVACEKSEDKAKMAKEAPEENGQGLQVEIEASAKCYGIDAKSLDPDSNPSDMKVSVVTWNLAESSPSEEEAGFFSRLRGSDLVLISGQECENIKPRRTEGHRSREFRRLMIKALGKKYVPLGLHMLGGLQFGLFCKRSFLAKVEFVSIADVTCGIGNVFHNKGAIGAFVQVKASKDGAGEEKRRAPSLKMLFVTAHMAAHVKNTEARDADFWRIVQELESQAPARFLPPNPTPAGGFAESGQDSGSSGSYLLDSMDRVFFCGDLNYRINLPREEAEHLVLQLQTHPNAADDKVRERLLRHDQLLATMAAGHAFTGLCEGKIDFLPTFKFDKGTDEYDTSHKQRVPAWTDRVVFKPTGTRLLCYASVPDALHSDHRPVFASFQVSTLGSALPPKQKKKRSRGPARED